MRKLVALSLTLMLILSLSACGGETKSDNSDGTNSSHSESKMGKKELSFTEAVAVDNEECSIKIVGIEPGDMFGLVLKAQLENKSADKTYTFSVEESSINGVQSTPFFATDVAAGEKSDGDIFIDDEELEENGVGDFTDIELTFRVYDSNDWEADAVAEETVHIYPYGEDKATKFVREAQASDNVIIDNDYVTVIVTGYEDDESLGYTVNLFLLNKTDKRVWFEAEEASVNGLMADPFYYTTVSAGNCEFSSMSWSDDILEENSITEVEEIEFNILAYDESDKELANKTITLNP